MISRFIYHSLEKLSSNSLALSLELNFKKSACAYMFEVFGSLKHVTCAEDLLAELGWHA